MDIDIKINEFKEAFLPKDFEWRLGQKEAITQIIQTYLEGKYKIVILDAPTGSGKSIIAMATSWLINSIEKDGYILASDIALQEQYESDISRMNMNWGSVKGIDNYKCDENGEVTSLGVCKMRNKNPVKLPCYEECPYFSARDHASKTRTSVLNYAYWLIMMNYVLGGVEHPRFVPREFLIADEAHKIIDIVQNHYSPRFDKNIKDKLEKLTEFFYNNNIEDHNLNMTIVLNEIETLKSTENQDKLFASLSMIENNILAYLTSVNVLKTKVDKEYKNSEPPKNWKKILKIADWIKDFHCKIEDYVDIIDRTSTGYIVKNPKDNELVFNCLYESYLMHKYFHKWSKFTVLMSATFSDPKEYLRSISIKGAKYIKMESSFDFAKSPIYFYNKRKMSFKHIDENLPWLTQTINDLLKQHNDVRGIIHTASYHLTMKIWEGLDNVNKGRVLVYSGTEEKKQMLEQLKNTKNKILMGPSLLEGLDLRDNWSRLQIFAKVPYLSLGDKFVKAKMGVNPGWYQWKAIQNLAQGLGRSVRSKDDWAITYILDGALGDLLHKNRSMFPKEIINRLKLVKE